MLLLVKTSAQKTEHLEYNMNKHFEQRFSFITVIDMVCFTALISGSNCEDSEKANRFQKIQKENKGRGRGRDILPTWQVKAKELH